MIRIKTSILNKYFTGMSNEQFYKTELGQKLKEFKQGKGYSHNIPLNRPKTGANEFERLEYLIPKSFQRITDKGRFTSYYFLKIKNLLTKKLQCESGEINRLIKDFGLYLKEKETINNL